MLVRLKSLNPVGLVLLMLGVLLMFCGRFLPEKCKMPAKYVSLVLALAGAALCFS